MPKIRLNSRVKVLSESDSTITFLFDEVHQSTFNVEEPALKEILLYVAHEGIDISLIDRLRNSSLIENRFNKFIEQMKNKFFVKYQIDLGGEEITVSPINRNFDERMDEPIQEIPYVLSKYSCFRPHGENFLLENPLASCQITATYEGLRHIFSLLNGEVNFPDKKLEVNWLYQILISNKFINERGQDDDITAWEFHDLFFHHHSRLNDSDTYLSFGATNIKSNRTETSCSNEKLKKGIIRLQKAGQNSANVDPEFFKVLESRRSYREFDDEHAINEGQLGEFLYHSLAIHERKAPSQQLGTRRAFPSAGAVHDLEFYLVIGNCSFLNRGIYHYRAKDHTLCPLRLMLRK